MSCSISLERKLLTFSTASALVFALMGIGLGVWMGSLVILFDGAYSLVSLLLTTLSLAAAWYIRSPGKHRNKSHISLIEPAVIAFKGIAIALMCVASFTSALLAILAGGREVDTGLALVFGVINLVGCLATYWLLAKRGGKTKSALIEAESKQWLMDSAISAAVMAGFIIASLLSYAGLAKYAVFADPVMVVIASVYFTLVPLKMTQGALRQLLVLYRQNTDTACSSAMQKAG
ncbi:cation transporter [Pseudoalteromonas sp. BDTF-M6]|uniref:cation transporter n=1 Tax=Pseudoalteromonas sp. BDTF-M6 TaxID=2796132 RepID=UPI001BAE8E87|nr:cation transporter [Pseudoalteromonas sp. BDTF-M6]MBS3797867.1 cation transporter [Pseudoalteromonas sp. BDTF-M6]